MAIRTSGIVVFRETCRGNVRLLLLQRANGEYDIPKGRIDPGETPLQSALREVEEETGIEEENIDIIEGVSCEVRTETGARYGFFLGETEEKLIDLTEHDTAYWVSIDYAIELLQEDTPHLALAVQHLVRYI